MCTYTTVRSLFRLLFLLSFLLSFLLFFLLLFLHLFSPLSPLCPPSIPLFPPSSQVATDPRFGRVEENFGADPFLVSEMAVAAVNGLQGRPVGRDEGRQKERQGEGGDDDGGSTSGGGGVGGRTSPTRLRTRKITGGPNTYLRNAATGIISEAKHFAAYGFGDHDGAGADVSIPTLYDVYLRPWKAYIDAGGRGAMAAHNQVNGQPCHSSRWLLHHVLRGDLGCADCLIGTDFNDINNLINFNTANSSRYGEGMAAATDGAIQSLTAGVDQDLGGTAFTALEAAANAGLFNVSALTRAAGNVLRAKFAARLFEHPMTDTALCDHVDSKAHRSLARLAAVEGAVLLQDPGRVLPLSLAATAAAAAAAAAAALPRVKGPIRSIALVGPNAGCDPSAASRASCAASEAAAGGYHPPLAPGQVVTALDAFRRRAPSTMNITYAKGVDALGSDTSGIAHAVALAAAADVAVVVLGDGAGTCGEAMDRMEVRVCVCVCVCVKRVYLCISHHLTPLSPDTHGFIRIVARHSRETT